MSHNYSYQLTSRRPEEPRQAALWDLTMIHHLWRQQEYDGIGARDVRRAFKALRMFAARENLNDWEFVAIIDASNVPFLRKQAHDLLVKICEAHDQEQHNLSWYNIADSLYHEYQQAHIFGYQDRQAPLLDLLKRVAYDVRFETTMVQRDEAILHLETLKRRFGTDIEYRG